MAEINKDDLYSIAVKQMKEFSTNIIDDCIDFANDNDYEIEWVLDKFQEEFSKTKLDFLRRLGNE